jgi:hypothetical protein
MLRMLEKMLGVYLEISIANKTTSNKTRAKYKIQKFKKFYKVICEQDRNACKCKNNILNKTKSG